MKMKSIAILTLLVASFAYIAPAIADDMSGDADQSMQQPDSDNNMSNNPPSNSSAGSNGSGISDQNVPDTATGDDDY